MSDYLIVRGGKHDEVQEVLLAWKAANQWVNLIELNHRWEPLELEINRSNAAVRLRGTHKTDLAELIQKLARIDVYVIQVKLRKAGREELDLIDWAKKTLDPG